MIILSCHWHESLSTVHEGLKDFSMLAFRKDIVFLTFSFLTALFTLIFLPENVFSFSLMASPTDAESCMGNSEYEHEHKKHWCSLCSNIQDTGDV